MSDIRTYPEMNQTIKDLLGMSKEPINRYILARIEELERETEQLRTPDTGNPVTPICFIQAQGYKGDKCLGVAQDGDDEPIEKCKQCPYCSVNERIAEPENTPLSLEELRVMDGCPVFVVHFKDYLTKWYIWNNEPLNEIKDGLEGYGEMWFAYRQKPEAKEEAE